jgi:hypothetical protein
MRIETIIKLISNNLSDDLLKPKYLIEGRNKFTGHCYVATEAAYHLLSNKNKMVYKPAILNINGDTHWFLKNILDHTIIDITRDQFDFIPNYNDSRGCGFLTKKPSKRTTILLNKIKQQ